MSSICTGCGSLSAALAWYSDQQIGNIFRLLLLTGARRGEVLATRWGDIDFGKKTLNIRKSGWQQHIAPVKTDESEKNYAS